jgi:eukaryotic-like serine/threonine-protein kinase
MPLQDDLPKDATSARDGDPATTISLGGAADAAEIIIGHYYLRRRLGEGGMGEVWLAEQKEPVRRRVALKLIKRGFATREAIVRFDSERKALALMDHPAIAKVFDAGTTSAGAPYFVMEYVAGIPITDYCDKHRLSTRERLDLFRHVCEGVQHAHQKAIIHRDLKPTNILVAEIDGKPVPKIIDFGVAKALTTQLSEETMFTRAGALVGTPEYMSPEQANSEGEDIDTRTDVYSLGIIFYELLAGAPPIELRKVALAEFLRRLREEEPPKPSTKISAHTPATSTDVAKKRQTEPRELAKQLRGELDSIALMSLEKERSRRYASASEFAADITRYLNNEPVLAVPPSLAYRARKFVRRNRASLATACAFVAVLIAASVISIRQSIRANRAAAVAQAVNDFLQHDLLSQATAYFQTGTKLDPDIKVRTALDHAATRIEGKFQGQPEVEAAIRVTIARTYEQLGQLVEAQKQFERAMELQRKTLGDKNPETVETESELGEIARIQGRYPAAETLLSQALGLQRRVPGPENPQTLKTMSNLFATYSSDGKFAQAEALGLQTVETQRRVLGPENGDTLSSMNRLAIVYFEEGKVAQAEALHNQTLEIRRRVLGPEHPITLRSMGNLANVYIAEGKFAQADALESQTAEIQRRLVGPENPDTLLTENNLAAVYSDEGKFAEAAALDKQVLESRRHVLGPENQFTLDSMCDLASDLSNEGKYAQAEALFSQALGIARRTLGPEHPYTLNFDSEFASAYQRQGKYAQAETYAKQALAGRRKILGSEHPDTISTESDLALAYVSEGKFAESEPLAREGMETDKKVRPDDWQRFRAESLLGAGLAGEKKYAEAEPLLIEGYQGMLARKDSMSVPDQYNLELARKWLVKLYQDWGKPDQAAEWEKK